MSALGIKKGAKIVNIIADFCVLARAYASFSLAWDKCDQMHEFKA